jgi:hypothetical protein
MRNYVWWTIRSQPWEASTHATVDGILVITHWRTCTLPNSSSPSSLVKVCPIYDEGHIKLMLDYNNSRIMDFQTVEKFTSNALAIQDAARMRQFL